MGFIREFLAFAGAAAHHLGEEDAGFDGAEEDDVFEVGNIDAGGEHVDGDGDAGGGAVAEFADLLEGAVGVAGDFADEGVAAAEDFAGEGDELVGMGGVGEVIDGEDEGLGEAAGLLLVFKGVGFDFFEDAAVGIRGGDVAFEGGGIELALVFEEVELFGPGIGVDGFDFLAFVEEDAVDADFGFNADDVVINQVAFGDGGFVFVAGDDFLKEGGGVGGGGGGETDFDGVEMVQGATPEGGLGGGVAAMAFVGDDEVEGVDGDGELLGVFVVRLG